MLLRGACLDQVTEQFQAICFKIDTAIDPNPISSSQYDKLTVQDGWRAVKKARDNGCQWVDFMNGNENNDCIDMEEYLHCDSPVNGCLHVVVPSQGSGDRQWADEEDKRYFAPAFYAEILSCEYGMQLVVCCDAELVDAAHDLPTLDTMEDAGDRQHLPLTPFKTYDAARSAAQHHRQAHHDR